MEEKSDAQDSGYRIADRMQGLSNSELISVLKKRALYRPEASEIAVREAIRRGIIRSEEDLKSPEYEPPVTKFTLFPFPDSEHVRNKIIKSLMRSVMIAGIVPVYFGVMKFTIIKYIEGAGLISIGIIWVALAWFIMEKSERRFIIPMFVLSLLSIVYAGRIMLAYSHLKWTDYFITVVLYLFIFYALIYAHSLLRKKEKSKEQ